MTPSAYTMFAHWIPKQERSTALATIAVGGNIGAMVTMPLSGILCKHGFAGGWPSVFYTQGLLGAICCAIWLYCVYNNPEEHPRIQQTEKMYIKQNVESVKTKKNIKAPWKGILTSKRVWAVVAAKFTGNWGSYMIMTKIPAYLAEVMDFPIEQVSVLHCV